MNKKLNTALFLAAASMVNVLIVVVIALVVFVPYALWAAPSLPGAVNLAFLLVVIFGSLAVSFPLYRRWLEWLKTKINFDKYFDPMISRKTAARRRR